MREQNEESLRRNLLGQRPEPESYQRGFMFMMRDRLRYGSAQLA